jgi:2-oxoglutarate ferredoxin oxidoreductase subunit gamma
MSTEIRLAGEGGQGLIKAGFILGESATVFDKKNAVQTSSYGVEARGGESSSDIIISDGKLYFPRVRHLDILLSFTQTTANKYVNILKDSGKLFIDDDFVQVPKNYNGEVFSFPYIRTARSKFNLVIIANIIALSSIAYATNVVSIEALRKAVLKNAPEKAKDMNLEAIDIGISFCKQ